MVITFFESRSTPIKLVTLVICFIVCVFATHYATIELVRSSLLNSQEVVSNASRIVHNSAEKNTQYTQQVFKQAPQLAPSPSKLTHATPDGSENVNRQMQMQTVGTNSSYKLSGSAPASEKTQATDEIDQHANVVNDVLPALSEKIEKVNTEHMEYDPLDALPHNNIIYDSNTDTEMSTLPPNYILEVALEPTASKHALSTLVSPSETYTSSNESSIPLSTQVNGEPVIVLDVGNLSDVVLTETPPGSSDLTE